ncbi:MAG: hypothetical protein AB1610_02670 [Nitrospirota bacterium]
MRLKILLIIMACLVLGVATVFAAISGTIGSSGSPAAPGTLGTSYTFLDPNGNATTLQFSPSTQVYVGINSSGPTYAANSKHYNGDREFGVASNATAIFWIARSTGVVLAAVPTTTGANAFSGWSTL